MAKPTPNQVIKNNYQFYVEIVDSEKKINSEEIVFSKLANNSKWRRNDSGLVCEKDSLTFRSEWNTILVSQYAFKLFHHKLGEAPFYRFDSDGLAHENEDGNLTLLERRIPTPHFHKYNQNGIEIAFRNELLNDPIFENDIRSDINQGLRLFCGEAKITTTQNKAPFINHQIKIINPLDPHEGVKFV